MQVKRILYPTDFTEGSQVACPLVADLVRRYGAKLYVVHVLYDIAKATGWYVPHVSTDELYRELQEGAMKQLERCVIEDLRGYKDIQYEVLRGSPTEEILRYAKEQDIDLIVMGTHGRKGLDKVLFGSTAAKVVREAPCSVLVVRSKGG
jgi:nucleotide-binding universal stress UspA family protein